MKDVVLDNLVLTAVPTAVVDVIWNDVSRVLRRSVLTAGGRFELMEMTGHGSPFYRPALFASMLNNFKHQLML